MNTKKVRFISAGQLPNSEGGAFNCSALAYNQFTREIIVRVEPSDSFTGKTEFWLAIENIDKLRFGEVDQVRPLAKVGFPANAAIEDPRLFYYKGERYAIHTLLISKGGWELATTLKPVISKVTKSTIELIDYCELPYVPRKIGEKNWLPVVYNDELYVLYSLDPIRIFKLEGWSWREVKFEDTGLAAYVKKMLPGSSYLSLSAITHFSGDQYLGMWHVRQPIEGHGEIYKQGMFILNMKTLKIENFTPPVLEGGGDTEGVKPNCLYISGLIITQNSVEAYAGEGDSNSVLIELDINDVTQKLSEWPYEYEAPLRVLFRDFGVGDFICMTYALMGWMKENGRGVKLFTHNNLQLASALKIPGVTVCQWHGEPFDVDLSSNEDSLPEEMRKTYQEKLKGSLKGWYAKNLGSTCIPPSMEHLTPMEEVSDAIVLFPFAAHEIRCWPLKNWIQLTEELIKEGYRVIISDPFPARCKNLPGEHQTGTSMLDVLRLLKGCKMVIANESGGAHLAGLFETPTLVLSGWLDPEKVYDYTNNQWIFKRPLSSITVEEVKEKIKQMVG